MKTLSTLRAATALFAVMMTAACATDPLAPLANTREAKIIDSNPWAGHPLAASRLSDSPELKELIASAAGTDGDIGLAAVPPPAPSSWIAGFGLRVLESAPAYVRDDKSEFALDQTDFVMLAAMARAIGRPDKIAEIESVYRKTRQSWIEGSFRDACTRPADDDGLGDACANRAATLMELATFARLRGDHAEAGRRHDAAMREGATANARRRVVTLSNGSRVMESFQTVWLSAWTIDAALAGDAETAAEALAIFSAYSEAAGTDLGFDPARILRVLHLAGDERKLAAFIRRAEERSLLAKTDDLGLLFAGLDAAITRGEGPTDLRRRMRLIAAIRDMKPKARALWYNGATVGLECRLAHVLVAEGRRDAALRLFERTMTTLANAPGSLRDTEFCLYRLAPRVGRQAAQVEIAERMRSQFERSRERVEAVYRYQSAVYARLGSQGDSRKYLALLGVQRLIGPDPAGWILIDDRRTEETLVAALEATKNQDLLAERGKLLTDIMVYALDGWRVSEGQ
ncbi:MAG TPA: hypothetical protein VF274_02540 [Alphaproteobacteria bacterium]